MDVQVSMHCAKHHCGGQQDLIGNEEIRIADKIDFKDCHLLSMYRDSLYDLCSPGFSEKLNLHAATL